MNQQIRIGKVEVLDRCPAYLVNSKRLSINLKQIEIAIELRFGKQTADLLDLLALHKLKPLVDALVAVSGASRAKHDEFILRSSEKFIHGECLKALKDLILTLKVSL